MSSLTSSSENKILFDQENEFNFDSSAQNLPTPSPNRSKYEGKFGKRRPLGEKTANKNTQNSIKLKEASCKTEGKKQENTEKEENYKEKKAEDTISNTTNNTGVSASNVSFQDLFHLNESHQKSEKADSNSSNSKIEELSMALSETLQENEQLHDTISLLKAEIDRLNGELLENKEYAELYLLSKELIENQAEEIENLKKKLVKRGD